jgi:quinol-cytochrome oxidoreductase complex cytochrome b subunit
MDGSDKERAGRGRRLVTAVIIAAVAIIVDVVILTQVVPFADEESNSHLMSVGFIITYFLVFCNLLVVLAIIAYMVHQDSYPSDRWK